MDLNLMAIQAQYAREQREAQLLAAFRDDRRRRDLVLRDCANLVACIGGYAAPFDLAERGKRIEKQWLNDPAFYSKVQAVAALVEEYITCAFSGGGAVLVRQGKRQVLRCTCLHCRELQREEKV